MDRQPRAKVESTLLSDGQSYALLYLRLLKKLVRPDTQQCLLVLIADALAGTFLHPLACMDVATLRNIIDHEERIPLFMRTSQEDPELPYGPLLR